MTKFERIIARFPPVAFILRKSRTARFPGSRGLSVYEVTGTFFSQINKVGLYERAAAISFNLVMALPATFLFLLSVIPYLPDANNFRNQILHLFQDVAPSSATYKFFENVLNDLLKKQIGFFSFGFLLVMFYSSNAMIGVIRTFDRSIAENRRYFLHKRLRAIRITFLLMLLIFGCLLMLIGQQQLGILLKHLFQMKRRAHMPWWSGVRWIIIVFILFYCIAFIYKFAPSIKKRWPLLSVGSIVSTALILATTILFSYWVNNFASYNRVYGSIGTVMIIMVLIYINSLILLIGFELNVSITHLHAPDVETMEDVPVLTEKNLVGSKK